eukprot:3248255-Rhodomonas_salina.3
MGPEKLSDLKEKSEERRREEKSERITGTRTKSPRAAFDAGTVVGKEGVWHVQVSVGKSCLRKSILGAPPVSAWSSLPSLRLCGMA